MSDRPPPEIEYDFDPRKLPAEYLQAIGLVAANSAQTEAIVQDAIAGCLNLDSEQGPAITTHMSMPLRFSALKAAAEIKIDDLDSLDMLDELIDAIEDAFDLRNSYLHHRWCRNPDTDQVYTVKEKARTRYEIELIPMSINAIKSDATAIYQSGINLYQFLIIRGLIPRFAPFRPRTHKSKPARKKRREALLRAEAAKRDGPSE
jgi:hypothetical protein